jgi:processive 1,2-diacylglycerol beta-glucosyltransferase
MTHKKILLLSVSAGAGHTRAADAIGRNVEPSDGDVTLVHLDTMNFVTPLLRKIYTVLYIFLAKKAPLLCGLLYQIGDRANARGRMQSARRWLERRNAGPLIREVAALRPDAIICTHFLPAEILSHLIAHGQLHCPVWVVVTDFDLHRMWIHEHMAGYFAANDEVAFRLRAKGIAADAIHVTGIPIMPAFSRQPERVVCAREFGLDPKITTLLLMGGGDGLGKLPTMAARLLELDADFQLIVLVGRNTEALIALQPLVLAYPSRLLPCGFTNQVERLMACADLVITKTGGSSTSECLAMGLPLIANAPIPGQEERNADFLLEQGAALKAFDWPTLEYRIRYLLAHPAKRQDMQAKAKSLGRPDAARRVLDIVLGKPERST